MRKCWFGIQSAFTSCLIIFLELAVLRRQYNLRPQSADSELVSTCLYALEFCAPVDAAAKSFLNTLVQIRNILFANTPELLSTTQPHGPCSLCYPTTVTGSGEPSISSIKPPHVFTSANPEGESSHSAPSILTSYPAATTSQLSGGQEEYDTDGQSSKVSQTDRRGDQTIEFLLTHIINCLESPYGGDHNVTNESSHNLGSFPVNWRFLNPKSARVHMNLADPAEPSPLSPQTPRHLSTSQIQGSSRHEFFPPPGSHPSISSPVAAMHNTDYSSENKSLTSPGGPLPDFRTGSDELPFKSMEEYKEFLRRIA